MNQRLKRASVNLIRLHRNGSRQQLQPRKTRRARRPVERVAAPHHIEERESCLGGHTERNVEVPQAEIRIDAQNARALHAKTPGHAGAHRRFAGSALAGYDRQNLPHAAYLRFAQ